MPRRLRQALFYALLAFVPTAAQGQLCPITPCFGDNEWYVLAYNSADYTNYAGYYVTQGHPVSLSTGIGADDVEFNTCLDEWLGAGVPYQCYDPGQAPVNGVNATPSLSPSYAGTPVTTNTPGGASFLAKRQGFEPGYYRLRLHKFDDAITVRIDVDGDGLAEDVVNVSANCCAAGVGTYGDIWTGFLGTETRIEIGVTNVVLTGNNYFYAHVIFYKDEAITPTAGSVAIETCVGGTANLSSYDAQVLALVGAGNQVNWFFGDPNAGGIPVPDPSAANLLPAQSIANSLADFSATQGSLPGQWQYGAYSGSNYLSFAPLTYDPADMRWESPGATLSLPFISASNAHPSISNTNHAVRRWVSDYAGLVTITGAFADADPNNTGGCFGGTQAVRILLNGTEIYQAANISSDTTAFIVSAQVAPGDVLDFVVDADGQAFCDDTYWVADIAANVVYAQVNDAFETVVATTYSEFVNATLSATPDGITSPGDTDGSIELCLSNGPGPYVVSVSPAAGTVFQVPGTCAANFLVSGLPQGQYDISVTDGNGCLAQADDVNIVVEGCSGFELVQITPVPPSCAGAANGALMIQLQNIDDLDQLIVELGNGLPNRVFDNPGSMITVGDLPAGDYNVTLIDQFNCQVTYLQGPTVLSDPDPLVFTLLDVQNASTLGGNDGAILLCAEGGTGAPNPVISPAVGSLFFTNNVACDGIAFGYNNLPAGSYEIALTDANGCSDTLQVQVNDPSCDLDIESIQPDSAQCFGSPGNLSITAAGGDGLYAFSLDGGATFSPLQGDSLGFFQVPAGTYDIVVQDGSGCTASGGPQFVAQPSAIVPDVTLNHVNVQGGNNGSISICLNGGNPNYEVFILPALGSYIDNGSNPDCAQSVQFANLPAGIYEIYVRDSSSCGVNLCGDFDTLPNCAVTVEILEPTCGNSVNASLDNTLCYDDLTGTITASVQGGAAPYTFEITGAYPVTTPNNSYVFTGLPQGQYYLSVTDANGCFVPYPLDLNIEDTDYLQSPPSVVPPCEGLDNGEICLVPLAGTGPYAYTASCGAVQSGPGTLCAGDFHIPNLEAGDCFITLTDVNACVSQGLVTVSELALSATAVVVPTCQGLSTGSIDVTPLGGSAPFDYAWSNGAVEQDQDNLPSGNYGLTITDARGCTTTQSYSVGSYTVSLSGQATPVICAGESNGVLNATASGGFAPYAYQWSNNASGPNQIDVAAGTYSVTATDDNGCSATQSFTIGEADVNLSTSSTGTCFGADQGSVSVSVSGGNSPYLIAWSNGVAGDSQDNLAPGTYTVTVTDANGCSETASAEVLQFTPFDVEVSEDASIVLGQSAPLVTTIVGGVPPFSVAWSPTTGIADPNSQNTTASPSETTTYVVTVTDINGCQVQRTVLITVTPPPVIVMPTGFSPNADGQNDAFAPFIPQDDVNVLSFKVYNRWGTLLHDAANSAWDGTFNGQDQPIGTYVYVLEYQDPEGATQMLKGHFSLLR